MNFTYKDMDSYDAHPHTHTRTTFGLLLRSNTAWADCLPKLPKSRQDWLHLATLVALAYALAICIDEMMLADAKREGGGREAV